MRYRSFFLILLFLSVNVFADGCFIPSDSSVYYDLVEDHQIVVVDVVDEETINGDLFISLRDESNQSHDIVFLLPFYEKPNFFNLEEKNYSVFCQDKTDSLDDFIKVNDVWWAKTREKLYLGIAGGYFISGGPGVFPLLLWQMGVFSMGGVRHGLGKGDIIPEEVLSSEHTLV